MQMKHTIRQQCVPTGVANVKCLPKTYVSEVMQELSHSHMAYGEAQCYSYFGKQFAISFKQ
jgi:hypothetical protein